MWTAQHVKAYLADPILWLRDVLKVEPYPWQEEVFRDIAAGKHNLFAIKSCNGAGKTAFLSWLILWYMTTHKDAKVQATSPTEDQLFRALWAEIAKWMNAAPDLKRMLTWSQTKIVFNGYEGTWWAVARTSRVTADGKVSEGLQGIHDAHTLCVIDEASGVPEQAISALYGMMATGKATIVMTGNPLRITGTFYEAFHKLKELFKTYTVSYKEAPGVTQEFVDLIERTYGRESIMYTARILGEFPSIESYVMFSPEDIDKMYDKHAVSTDPVIIGCDISDGGDCESVFTVRKGPLILEQRAFRSIDCESNADALETLIGEYKPVRVMIDALNIGSGVLSIMKRRGYTNVYGVKGSNSPKDKSFFNVRSELYFQLAKLVREGVLKTKFPAEKLKGNLIRHFQEPREDGLFAVITKAKLRKDKRVEEGGSPDYSDSLIYSLYGDEDLFKRKNPMVYMTNQLLLSNNKFRKKPGAMGFSTIRNSRFSNLGSF